MDTIRFGLVGAGQIADISAGEINNHKQATVVAIQDLNESRCKELSAKHDIPNTFATSEELFACDEVDAVYIAVPNKFHATLAIQALNAGKHVILEKPFAMNAEEAEQVIAVAKASGRCFTLGMNMRFMPEVQKVKAVVDAGELGDIYHETIKGTRMPPSKSARL